ncbi:MAG TPA: hypothetical protein VN428_15705 [Bryobacteraceae bacterium]|nr:hypothetical protein [Bryobacteraceae bacterium]
MRTATVTGLLTLFAMAGSAQTVPARVTPQRLRSAGPQLSEFAIIGAPYTCDVMIEITRIGEDGTRFRTTSPPIRELRDPQGRIRTERKELRGSTEVAIVSVVDPVTGTGYILSPDGRVTRTTRVPAAGSKPALEVYQSPVAAGTIHRTDSTVVRESLGARMIEGIHTEGWRFARTFPAGAMGNDRPFTITEERWVAPQLALALLVIHSDPRTGERTGRRTNIQLSEPDPSLFQPRSSESGFDNTDPLQNLFFGTGKK